MQDFVSAIKPSRTGGLLNRLTWVGLILFVLVCGLAILWWVATGGMPVTRIENIFGSGDMLFSVDYEDLARNTEDYVGSTVLMGGQVVQVTEHWNGTYTLLTDVANDIFSPGKMVILGCRCNIRPLADDYITFYASVKGRKALPDSSTKLPHMVILDFSVNE